MTRKRIPHFPIPPESICNATFAEIEKSSRYYSYLPFFSKNQPQSIKKGYFRQVLYKKMTQ